MTGADDRRGSGRVNCCSIYLSRAQLCSRQHVFRLYFDRLRRNHSVLLGNSGIDHAGLDPKAVSAQKPERPPLHRCQYRAACECRNWNYGRFANCGCAHGVGESRSSCGGLGTTSRRRMANWNELHGRFEMKRINHEEAYSLDGACTNWAEEFFSRMRRGEIGHHHHLAGAYLLRYAQEASWREDNRRVSNGDQLQRVSALAMRHKPSVDSAATGKGMSKNSGCVYILTVISSGSATAPYSSAYS
jgi:ISXO2-like transposase domain